MCGNDKKYFYYDNQKQIQKIEIGANVILNNELTNISNCENATIIATKKTTQQ